ncbi:MAG: hypothetical protein NT008_05570 [Methylococcales bacterium]|nr:hypothetical protein [Methylococcales bacterium]
MSASLSTKIRGFIMKDEYDFSKAVRGRFYHADAQLNIPVH